MAELPPTERALEEAFRNARKPKEQRAAEAYAEGLQKGDTLYYEDLEAGAQVSLIIQQRRDELARAAAVKKWLDEKPWITRDLKPPRAIDPRLDLEEMARAAEEEDALETREYERKIFGSKNAASIERARRARRAGKQGKGLSMWDSVKNPTSGADYRDGQLTGQGKAMLQAWDAWFRAEHGEEAAIDAVPELR